MAEFFDFYVSKLWRPSYFIRTVWQVFDDSQLKLKKFLDYFLDFIVCSLKFNWNQIRVWVLSNVWHVEKFELFRE